MPYQGQIKLGGFWYALAEDKEGKPLYRQDPAEFFPPQVAQAEVNEGNTSPEIRIPFSFRDLSRGTGVSELPTVGTANAYQRIGDAEGEGVDATLTPTGPIILAAELQIEAALAPAPTSNILGMLWKGGSNTAYFASGRYVYSWTGAAFANVGDLGNGNATTDALLNYRGAQTQDHWYACLGAATIPKYSIDSGVTWANVGGVDFVNAISAVVIDGEVVFARASDTGQGSAMVAMFNNGGTAPEYFAKIDPVGDPSFPIARVIAFQGRVLVLKDGEGVFLLTADRREVSQELFPELKGAKLYSSGAKVWRGLLWLPTDQGLYVITPGFTLQKVGPERFETAISSGSRGVVTAVAGDAHNLYAFRSAGSGNPCWLYKAVVTVSGGGVQSISWFDYLQLASGVTCQSVNVLSPGGNGPKLLLDRQTSGGAFTAYWLKLPANGRDPRADTAFRYCAGGTLYFPRHTARFPTVNKTYFGVLPLLSPLQTKVDQMTATTAQSVRGRYKLDSTALTSVTPFGYTPGAAQTTGTGARDQTAIRGRGLDAAIRLASSDNTTSPQVQAVTVEYDLEPDSQWKHSMTLAIGLQAPSQFGRITSNTPSSPRAALTALRALPGSGVVSFSDPWDNSYDVTIPLKGIAIRPGGGGEMGANGDLPMYVDVLALEQLARAQGTYDALMSGGRVYSSLQIYQYAQLSSIN